MVDDSATVRQQVGVALTQAGFVIMEARDGEEGKAKIDKGGIDCVICDVNMPNLNGIDMVADVKEDARHQQLPIIMLTTEDRRVDRQRQKGGRLRVDCQTIQARVARCRGPEADGVRSACLTANRAGDDHPGRCEWSGSHNVENGSATSDGGNSTHDTGESPWVAVYGTPNGAWTYAFVSQWRRSAHALCDLGGAHGCALIADCIIAWRLRHQSIAGGSGTFSLEVLARAMDIYIANCTCVRNTVCPLSPGAFGQKSDKRVAHGYRVQCVHHLEHNFCAVSVKIPIHANAHEVDRAIGHGSRVGPNIGQTAEVDIFVSRERLPCIGNHLVARLRDEPKLIERLARVARMSPHAFDKGVQPVAFERHVSGPRLQVVEIVRRIIVARLAFLP